MTSGPWPGIPPGGEWPAWHEGWRQRLSAYCRQLRPDPRRLLRGFAIWLGLWAVWLGATAPLRPSGGGAGRVWLAALEQYWAACYLLIYLVGKWRAPEPWLDRVMKVLAVWAGLPLLEGAVLFLLALLARLHRAFGYAGWLWVNAFGPLAALYFLAFHPFSVPTGGTSPGGASPGGRRSG